MRTALITGVTGQDGSFLAELLLDKGYDVHGTIRRSSVDYRERIAHLEGHKNFHLHYADLGDSMSLLQVIGKVRPDEIYNLAAQSHVQVSFDAQVCCVFLRLYVSAGSHIPVVFIRLRLPSFMERLRRCLRTRILRSIRIPLMLLLSCTDSGS